MNKTKQILWIILVCLITLLVTRKIFEKEVVEKTVNYTSLQIAKDQLWVEVILADEHKVLIRKGEEVTKEILCSGGTEEEPTVLGTYYLENRGEWFYSERFNEGAYHWVRFYKQYLFHSVPFDKDYNIIDEERNKIGKPASHGCIRLLEEDAKWFYDNIPDGTLVVIHE